MKVSHCLDTFFIYASLLQSVSSCCNRARVLYFCLFLTGRMRLFTEKDEGTFDACSALTSFVKHAERRMPVIACFVFEANPFLVTAIRRSIVLFWEGGFLVQLLASGFGERCRRFGGLGVRCRLTPLPFPLLWSCLNAHFTPLEALLFEFKSFFLRVFQNV